MLLVMWKITSQGDIGSTTNLTTKRSKRKRKVVAKDIHSQRCHHYLNEWPGLMLSLL